MSNRPVVLALAICFLSTLTLVSAADSGKQTAGPMPAKAGKAGKETAAAKVEAGYKGPPVLDPTQYFGGAAMGYACAKAAPDVMANLFCYCGCDSTDNHSYLIDCFTSNHGVDCHICQEEAVKALKMHRDNTPMAEIQKQIDEEFAHHYPWTQDTPAYKKYKAARLWSGAGAAGPQPATNGDATAGPLPAEEPKATAGKKSGKAEKASKFASGNKVKPGFKVGNCCGEHNK